MKRITRANIMGELVDKFALQEHEKEEFLFGEFVVPTYDIGAHVKGWESAEKRNAITADGTADFFNCPETERWNVRRVDVIHETGANFDVNQIFFYKSATEHQYLFFDETSPLQSGGVKIFDLPQDVMMDRGGFKGLRINVANFVAGGYISINMWREVETIR